jgi:hypothetical protein
MKTFKITFYDTRLQVERVLNEYGTSISDACTNFNFRHPDYLILNIEFLN